MIPVQPSSSWMPKRHTTKESTSINQGHFTSPKACRPSFCRSASPDFGHCSSPTFFLHVPVRHSSGQDKSKAPPIGVAMTDWLVDLHGRTHYVKLVAL